MERVKRQKSIDKIFARYIICFCLFTFSIAMFFWGFTLNGHVLPANYYENYIERNRNAIAKAKAKDVKLFIPEPCSYVVYNLEGKMVQGNVSEKKSLDIWNMLKKNRTISGGFFYKIIERKDEVCAVEYTLKAQFKNPVLRKHLPNPENIFLVLAPTLFITEVIVFSKKFRKRLADEMQLLKNATENIQMENLDFEIQPSNISEINEVLSALDKMKMELQQSLNKQWKMEEARKEQMASLAHDIKTPLTILKGNAELLNELNLNLEQTEFIKNILTESNRIEDYIKALIEIVKSERETELKKNQINLQNFIQDIVEVTHSMTRDKEIKFLSNIDDNIPEFFLIDEVALKRAIINVISNAVDYTPANGEILFNVYTDNKHIRFHIEDSGKGFTQEERNYATEQFFQGDKSRNSKNHYGMGLYIVKKIVSQHNGTIYLENSKKLSGARVVLEIPIIKC